jgi:YD repeat-containing protein
MFQFGHLKNNLILTMVLWVLLAPAPSTASYINDLHTGKRLQYHWAESNLQGDTINFYRSMNIAYPVFENMENESAQRLLNSHILYITSKQIASDSFRRELSQHLRSAVRVYMFTNKEMENERDLLSDPSLNAHPMVHQTDIQFFGLYKELLTIQISFHYKASFQVKELNPDFIYKQVYYVNLTSGKIYNPKQVFKKSAIPSVDNLIRVKLVKHLTEIKSAYGDTNSTFFYRHDVPILYKARLFRFSIQAEGFLYFKAFSYCFHISDFSPGTYQFKGLGIEIRLSPDELLAYLDPDGPFGSYVYELMEQNKVSLTHKDPENYIYQPLLNLLSHVKKGELANKSLIVENKEGEVATFVFNNHGLVKQMDIKKPWAYAQQAGVIRYTYNELGKLIAKEVSDHKKLEVKESYIYNGVGNVSSVLLSSVDPGSYKHIYYQQHGSYWLAELYNDDDHFPSIYRFEIKYNTENKQDTFIRTNFRSEDNSAKIRWPEMSFQELGDDGRVQQKYIDGKKSIYVTYSPKEAKMSEMYMQSDRVLESRKVVFNSSGVPLNVSVLWENGKEDYYTFRIK